MNKIKIFSTQTVGKNSFLVENNIFQPIRGGAVFDKSNSKIPGDDTEENISFKNKSYCELTVQYWVWKNVVADYYGFCHYRRYFSFSDKILEKDSWNVVLRDYLNKGTVQELRLDDEKRIDDVISQYDIIAAEAADLKKVHIQSVYEQYKMGDRLHIKDLDAIMNIIKEKYPHYYPAAQRYMNGTTMYMCNMFIMKRELFMQYSAWLFDILSEFEKQTDMSNYSIEGYRTPGHLGERLFGIFFTYINEQGKYKIHELQMVHFEHTLLQEEIHPYFITNNIPIVMSSNEKFVPFCAAAIQSMIDSCCNSNNYDIIMLERNMGEKTKNLFRKMLSSNHNFFIRFYDVGCFVSKYKLYEKKNISVETYFRLLIPELLNDYDKVLYLDGDIIIKDDIANLFHIDMEDNFIGGVVDVAGAGLINGFDKDANKYCEEKLRLKNKYLQFNAGVIIINNKALRQKFTSKYLLEFAQTGNFRFQDQDVLNILCEGKIKWLDPSWNFFADEVDGYRGYVEKFAPHEIYTAYRNASKYPKIIHYAGNEKPWYHPSQEWADEFWFYLSKTPFYNYFLHVRRVDTVWYVLNEARQNKKGFWKCVKKIPQKIADVFLPKGTQRREVIKKIYHIFVR